MDASPLSGIADRMSNSPQASDPMDFANVVGQEMWRLLASRGHEQLSADTNTARFTALLSAALIPIAEILRDPIALSKDRPAMAERLVELSVRQLHALLQGVVAAG
jgi:hypothetical protein